MRMFLLALCLTLPAACSCQRPAAMASAALPAAAAAQDAAAAPAAPATATIATAANARLQAQRAQAMSDAVEVVHGYLRELGSGQRAEAEKRWAYQRSPSVSEESGLRSLAHLQALRIENDAPVALDRDTVPAYIEVPVQLRATLDGGAVNRYRGWYRLRRDPVASQWELTAASISPVIR